MTSRDFWTAGLPRQLRSSAATPAEGAIPRGGLGSDPQPEAVQAAAPSADPVTRPDRWFSAPRPTWRWLHPVLALIVALVAWLRVPVPTHPIQNPVQGAAAGAVLIIALALFLGRTLRGPLLRLDAVRTSRRRADRAAARAAAQARTAAQIRAAVQTRGVTGVARVAAGPAPDTGQPGTDTVHAAGDAPSDVGNATEATPSAQPPSVEPSTGSAGPSTGEDGGKPGSGKPGGETDQLGNERFGMV